VAADFAACSGAVETGNASTLKARSDPNRPQADITANLLDMGVVSLIPA
jgi:hypothetical protein